MLESRGRLILPKVCPSKSKDCHSLQDLSNTFLLPVTNGEQPRFMPDKHGLQKLNSSKLDESIYIKKSALLEIQERHEMTMGRGMDNSLHKIFRENKQKVRAPIVPTQSFCTDNSMSIRLDAVCTCGVVQVKPNKNHGNGKGFAPSAMEPPLRRVAEHPESGSQPHRQPSLGTLIGKVAGPPRFEDNSSPNNVLAETFCVAPLNSYGSALAELGEGYVASHPSSYPHQSGTFSTVYLSEEEADFSASSRRSSSEVTTRESTQPRGGPTSRANLAASLGGASIKSKSTKLQGAAAAFAPSGALPAAEDSMHLRSLAHKVNGDVLGTLR